MPIGKNYRRDCVFKKFQGDKSCCNFPKTIKMCYTCGCYLKNDGNLDSNAKYITMVLGRRTAKMALFISGISLLISVLTLLLKLWETKNGNK